MHKVTKQVLAFGLSLCLLLPLVACGDSRKEEGTEKMAYGEIWSAPSTVKIAQDEVDYENKGDLELSYQAVRNEYESSQLIITAEKDVTSFELQTTDLKNGDHIFDGENITVYVEKYIQYNDSYGSGWMPDALIPMKEAKEYEENTIQAGKNGALWVTVYVPKETECGIYEGTFTLTIDGKSGEETIDVPVTLEVYDYELPDETTARTLFSWRYDRVAVGELDGSIDMMTYYYDFFQDYRISLEALPLETLSGEEFAENVLKYYDRLTTYTLLNTVGEKSGNLTNAEKKVQEQILAIAAECTEERNLFDKAMMYFIDEPRFDQESWRNNVIARLRKLQEMLQRCVDIIEADNTEKYAEFKKIENWENSILDITNVIPITGASVEWLVKNADTEIGVELLNVLNCFCPGFENYKLNEYSLRFLQEKYGIKIWWYGCLGPLAPAATYHIGDQNLLSARSISWMQKKYNIEGNLYWDAAAYTDEASEYYNEFIDVYEYPYRDTVKEFPAGDGFLAYPGEPYGVYGPIPSMRLMSIRDGMEEYELLYDIEEMYQELQTTLGSNFDYSYEMNYFYNAVGESSNNLYKDYHNDLEFTVVRTNLLQLVSSLKNGLGIAVDDIIINGKEGTFTYYLQEGATATINGEMQKEVSDSKYTYTLDLAKKSNVEITVTDANGQSTTHTRYIGVPSYVLSTLSDANVLNSIQVSEESTAALVSDDTNSTDGTAVSVNIKGVLTGNDLIDSTFIPNVSVLTSLFGELQPSELTIIHVDVYNPGDAFDVKVRLYNGTAYYEFGEFKIESGKNTLSLKVEPDKFAKLEGADRLAFEFANDEDGVAQTYRFYIDNIIGEK